MHDRNPTENFGAYKGYVYCQGHGEAIEVMKKAKAIVAERISDEVKVVLKRGCSEYALAYPEFVQNDENGESIMTYKEEWAKNEDFADKNLAKHIYPPAADSYKHNQSGLTLHDAVVMRIWLAYAAAIGDSSYLEISGAAMKKLPIKKDHPGKPSNNKPGLAPVLAKSMLRPRKIRVNVGFMNNP